MTLNQIILLNPEPSNTLDVIRFFFPRKSCSCVNCSEQVFTALFSQTPSSIFSGLARMERDEDVEEEEVLFRAEPVLVSACGTC